jgi:hypothetical protein
LFLFVCLFCFCFHLPECNLLFLVASSLNKHSELQLSCTGILPVCWKKGMKPFSLLHFYSIWKAFDGWTSCQRCIVNFIVSTKWQIISSPVCFPKRKIAFPVCKTQLPTYKPWMQRL